ncbi:glycoside hydrolase family 3 protein [Cohnella lupini]|uniref:beta-N-acetylhexosaminidase n=1 Tax=Cohnella lupini TaxID=1294267 RepID=A0A3D9ITD6_9BACL|nr:glycoside hydrolase family 3 protein [Cohnella lupini]RED64907.1 beta-N-acetylhexosaminidase [Cohnella lupini]
MDIKQLSLREKIGQTVVLLSNPVKETKLGGSLEGFLEKYPVGGFFVGAEIIDEVMTGGDKEQVKQATAAYSAASRVPLLFASDFENGCGSMVSGLTKLPMAMALGAAGSGQLAYDYGKATALEARSIGVNWTFSPVADLNQNRFNPITNIRAVSDEPELTAAILEQVIQGMQDGGLAAGAKHFPGDGNDYRDQHMVTTRNPLPMEEWLSNHGYVFQRLIDKGLYSIMTGHISLPAYQKKSIKGMPLPATLSDELTQQLLKRDMGFRGVVVSDALIMGGYLKWFARGRAEIECFKAGTDMMLWPGLEYFELMERAVETGEVSMERLDDAVSRILEMKRKLGLFDEARKVAEPIAEQETIWVRETARRVAEASITLLRDRNGLLPLRREEIGKALIIGISPNEEDIGELKGLTGVFAERGIEAEFRRNIWYEELEKIEAEFDLIVYAPYMRPHRPMGPMQYSAEEASAIWSSLTVAADKSVVVSFGSPYMFTDYFEMADVYLNAYSHVPATLKAAVDALFGEIPMTGKSPVAL